MALVDSVEGQPIPYAIVPGHYLSSEALALSTFRLAVAVSALLAFALLARWPRPRLALAVVLAMHVAAWLVYRAPLQRPYGLGEGSDRTFNVGMAASVALGHSPFEHTQVRHGSPEPLWNALVGGMARGHPERVPAAYETLTPVALLAVGLAAYAWIRRRDGSPLDAWDGVVAAFAVLGLSSLGMNRGPRCLRSGSPTSCTSRTTARVRSLAAAAIGICRPRRSRGAALARARWPRCRWWPGPTCWWASAVRPCVRRRPR